MKPSFPHGHARIWALALLLSPAAAATAPVVISFDRFHADEPTAQGGLLLYQELGCANCHGATTGLPARRGPALVDVTSRISSEWLTRFLANPSGTKPGTTMPGLLDRDEAADVLHFLDTLPGELPKPRMRPQVNAERGRALFRERGCAACHQPPGAKSVPVDDPHAPLGELAAKYDLVSLAGFLRHPLDHRPDGRMPDLELSDEEAGSIAAYLLDYRASDWRIAPRIPKFSADPSRAGRGRELFADRGCAACHDIPEEKPPTPVPIGRELAGCLAPEPRAGLPRYAFTDTQRRSLRVWLASSAETVSRSARTELTLEALNCLACHERAGRGGPAEARRIYFTGDPALGDTGRYPPPLTGVGDKLRPAWLKDVLDGTAPRMRSYLHTRMPVFGRATAGLADRLHQKDAETHPPLPAGDVEAGRTLLGTEGGLNCITCHRWGERDSLGIQAINLSNLYERLRPGWLRKYLIDPAAYRTGTLMPPLWPGGVASNQQILQGDTDRQIASLLAFARAGEGLPRGFPEIDRGQFELLPTDRPIIQRTFLERVGAHAVLVGFPEGVHFAYDGLAARPALLWKGRFFDAYDTWFTRAAPFEQPLGDEVFGWPAPDPLPERQFRGYRLDSGGIPTFLFREGDVLVEERLEPVEGGLKRTLTTKSAREPVPAESLKIAHPDGVTVQPGPSDSPGTRIFRYRWK